MTNEQREAIRQCELYVQAEATIQLVDEIDGKLAFKSCDTSAIDTVLSLIKEQQTDIESLERSLNDEILENYEKIERYSAELLQKNAEIAEKDAEIEEYRKIISSDILKIAKSDLVQEKNLELEKKDKIIDLMSEQLAGLTIWDTEKDEPLILGDKEAVINYFENKVNSKIQ